MSEEQMKLIEDGASENTEESTKKAAKKKDPAPKKKTNAEVIASYEEVSHELVGLGNSVESMEGLVFEVFQKVADIQTAISSRTFNKPAATVTAGTENNAEDGTAAPSVSLETFSQYLTSKEVFNYYTKQLDRREGELAFKRLRTLLIHLCLMRDDYKKLVSDMESNVDKFTAKDIIESFSHYMADIENMIEDAGVTYGPYESENGKVDAQHQRIINVIPTDVQALDETVAERLSPGYEFEGRALIKEKVNVYKVRAQAPMQTTSFREEPNQQVTSFREAP